MSKLIIRNTWKGNGIEAILDSEGIQASMDVEAFKRLIVDEVLKQRDGLEDALMAELLANINTKDLTWSFKAETITRHITTAMDETLKKVSPYLQSATERALREVIVEKLQKATQNVAGT